MKSRFMLVLCLACACGGRSALSTEPLGQAGPTLPTDAGAQDEQSLEAPRHVQASSDLEDSVRVRFDAPLRGSPSGYRVLRDGEVVATLDGSARTFDDLLAQPGALAAPTGLTASRGTREKAVDLTWTAPADATAGRSHEYTVISLAGENESVPSVAALGRRAAPSLLRYELSRDNERTWAPLPLELPETRYADVDAPAAIVEVGYAVAQALLVPQHVVRLEVHDSGSLEAELIYRVRALSAAGPSPSSNAALGYRKPGRLAYQWQRSEGPADTDYRDLTGITGPSWIDASLPPNTTRFYRAVLSVDDGRVTTTQGVAVTTLGDVVDASSDIGTCAVTSTGSLHCWGYRFVGYRDPTEERFLGVSTSSGTICALRDDHRMRCWGDGSDHSAPAGPSTKRYSDLDHYAGHLCAIRRSDQGVECSGVQGHGPIGPVPVNERFTKVTSSAQRFCGLRTDQRLLCWGNDLHGPSEPTQDRFVDVYLDSWRVFAVRTDGRLVVWSANPLPSFTVLESPGGARFVAVAGSRVLSDQGQLFNIRSDSAGSSNLSVADSPFRYRNLADDCAIRRDGKLDCFGIRESPLPSATPAKKIIFGGSACVLDDQDQPTCTLASVPLKALLADAAGTRVKDIVTTPSSRACILAVDGALACGPITVPGSTDVKLPGDERYTEVAASEQVICGIRGDGRLRCATRGVVDIAPPTFSALRYHDLTAGRAQVCALTEDGRPTCWGGGTSAVIPDEALERPAVDIAAGSTHTCVLRDDGVVTCWGTNLEGEAPRFREASDLIAIAAGNAHTCGLREDGRIVCWGKNLGQESSTDMLGRYTQVYAQESVTCGLRDDRKAVCWGAGFFGVDLAPLVTP